MNISLKSSNAAVTGASSGHAEGITGERIIAKDFEQWLTAKGLLTV